MAQRKKPLLNNVKKPKSKTKPFACKFCNDSFDTAADHNDHVDYEHQAVQYNRDWYLDHHKTSLLDCETAEERRDWYILSGVKRAEAERMVGLPFGKPLARVFAEEEARMELAVTAVNQFVRKTLSEHMAERTGRVMQQPKINILARLEQIQTVNDKVATLLVDLVNDIHKEQTNGK